MTTAITSRELVEETEYSIASLTHQVKEQNIEIVILKENLEQSKKNITTTMINTISFNNFIIYAQAVEDDIHVVKQEFYSKVVEFLDLYVKLQTLV